MIETCLKNSDFNIDRMGKLIEWAIDGTRNYAYKQSIKGLKGDYQSQVRAYWSGGGVRLRLFCMVKWLGEWSLGADRAPKDP